MSERASKEKEIRRRNVAFYGRKVHQNERQWDRNGQENCNGRLKAMAKARKEFCCLMLFERIKAASSKLIKTFSFNRKYGTIKPRWPKIKHCVMFSNLIYSFIGRQKHSSSLWMVVKFNQNAARRSTRFEKFLRSKKKTQEKQTWSSDITFPRLANTFFIISQWNYCTIFHLS